MTGLLTPQRQTAGNGLLDQAPRRVDDRVAGLLGLDPSIQRGAILPFGRDASGEMVMAWPEMALDTLKSLMLPGHVMQGGEFTPRDVTEMALDMGMLSTVAPAPAGAKRMFGGISAKNAPLDDLAKAEAMEKAGEAADDIWRATGWGRGADQKWRFEIDDSGATGHEYQLSPQQAFSRATADALFSGDSAASARLEQMKPYASKSTADLLDEYRRTGGEIVAAAERGDIERALSLGESRSGLDAILDNMRSDYGPVSSYLKHDDLNAAYPDVSGMHARVASDDLGGARGQYFQDSPVRREQIVMNEAPTWSGPRSTALHELQHAVQQREGFARGGNQGQASQIHEQAIKNVADVRGKAMDEWFAAAPSERPKVEAKWAPVVEAAETDLQRIAGDGADPLAMYRRLAGEVEARNVQSRMDMDAATRRATPPWSTEDVPRDQQIVRGLLGGDGPQMSASLPMDEASRMARADDLFPIDAYHGTNKDFREFGARGSATKAKSAKGAHWFTEDPRTAAGYADNAADADVQKLIDASYAAERKGEWDKAHSLMAQAEQLEQSTPSRGQNVIPSRLAGRLKEVDMDGVQYDPDDVNLTDILNTARSEGFDGVKLTNFSDEAGYGNYNPTTHYAIFDPKNIRSRFAAFDPARKDSTDILASYLGVPGIGMLDAMPQDDQSRERRGLLNN
jgi:hypothetical protein